LRDARCALTNRTGRTIVMIVMIVMIVRSISLVTSVTSDAGNHAASANTQFGDDATPSDWHSRNGDAECDGTPV
jgi:hypothetical protein